jgi:hypothetical protein
MTANYISDVETSDFAAVLLLLVFVFPLFN